MSQVVQQEALTRLLVEKGDIWAPRKDRISHTTLLKHIFTKAIEWGSVGGNPAKGVKLLDGEVERVRYLMPDELKTLLSNCDSFMNPIVTVAANTGLRFSELQGLKWENVNLELGIISILKTNTKNKARKDVPINEAVRVVLGEMKRNGPYVFYKGDGKPIKYSTIRKPFKKALDASGIEDFRFHDLRHTFGSNLVMGNVNILTVKDLMGHKDLKMTLRYSHLSPGFKAQAVSVLDQRFKSESHTSPESPPEETAEKDVWASA